MAYATSNGVVDTLQWEGRREAVDDLRYLSTLLEKIEEASKDPARAAEARNIKRYVMSNAGINQHGNLDKTRAKMVQLIMRLLPAEEQ
jgi:hypothetical protein